MSNKSEESRGGAQVLIDARPEAKGGPARARAVAEFHQFVTPRERPALTPFCTEL